MVAIRKYPGFRQLRAEASSHIQYFRKGKLKNSGRGLAFLFLPDEASISEIPMDDRQLSFFFKGEAVDFQGLSVQGTLMWRVANPAILGDRIDFTVDLDLGLHTGQPIDHINAVLAGLVQQFANAYLKQSGVRELLKAGLAPLQAAIANAFTSDHTLDEMGLELVGVSVTGLAPSSELSRALQAPTFESLQQQADEATFSRRALAVEKERAIAENELSNEIELATRQKELIARQDINARSEAEAAAAAMKIESDAEADRIRVVGQARVDMERGRFEAYEKVPPSVLLALAAKEFASKVNRIDNLTVTPDMLAGLVSQLQGTLGKGILGNSKAIPGPKAE